jgi:ubiquitin C-terminal hydrolase
LKSSKDKSKFSQNYGNFKSVLENNIQQKLMNEYLKKHNLENEAVELPISDINRSIKGSVSYQLMNLLKYMWKEQQVGVEPYEFKSTIGKVNDTFMGYNQHDSQELLSCVIDNIHEETKTERTYAVKKKYLSQELLNFMEEITKYEKYIKQTTSLEERLEIQTYFKKYCQENLREMILHKYILFLQKYKSANSSVITDIMTGTFCTETKCLECKYISVIFEPFQLLSLPIPDCETSLETCLENYGKEELLDGDNKYRCDECNKKVNAIKKTYIFSLPDYVLIALKRFNNNRTHVTKNRNLVKYPFDNLSFEMANSPYYICNDKYELYGVVQHSGDLRGGHYYSHAKNTLSNRWYKFDDSHVTVIDNDNLEKEIVSEKSYILAYKRKGLETPYITEKL